MPGSRGKWFPSVSTFDSPKVAKARLPIPCVNAGYREICSFFVSGGDIFADRLVTFLTAVWPTFIRKW